jgi:lipopolysaccharide export system protein LptA
VSPAAQTSRATARGLAASGLLCALVLGAARGSAQPPAPAEARVEEAETEAAGDHAPAGETGREKSSGTRISLPGSDPSKPIQIDADLLEFDGTNDVATFRGDVVTTQDDVVVLSKLLRVTFTPSEGVVGSFGRVQHVVAEGDVRITQGERVATGARAEFNDADRTVVLTGDTVLHEGANEIHGERVIVYLDEERSVVEGTNTRVRAIFMPKEKPAVGAQTDDAGATRQAEDPTDGSAEGGER